MHLLLGLVVRTVRLGLWAGRALEGRHAHRSMVALVALQLLPVVQLRLPTVLQLFSATANHSKHNHLSAHLLRSYFGTLLKVAFLECVDVHLGEQRYISPQWWRWC